MLLLSFSLLCCCCCCYYYCCCCRCRVLVVLRPSFFVFLASSWRPLIVQYSLLLVQVWFKGQNGMQERAFLLSCVLCSGF
jgi:hypothetical protein